MELKVFEGVKISLLAMASYRIQFSRQIVGLEANPECNEHLSYIFGPL